MTAKLVLVVGIVTMYVGIVGQPLYCDCDGTMRYDNSDPPWIALPVEKYGEWAECGDEIVLYGDGWRLRARALDAGPLSDYYIADFPELAIIADIPQVHSPFKGLSSRTRMINMARRKKEAERRIGR